MLVHHITSVMTTMRLGCDNHATCESKAKNPALKQAKESKGQLSRLLHLQRHKWGIQSTSTNHCINLDQTWGKSTSKGKKLTKLPRIPAFKQRSFFPVTALAKHLWSPAQRQCAAMLPTRFPGKIYSIRTEVPKMVTHQLNYIRRPRPTQGGPRKGKGVIWQPGVRSIGSTLSVLAGFQKTR